MEDADVIVKGDFQVNEVKSMRKILQIKIVDRIQRLVKLFWNWEIANPVCCWEAVPDPSNSVSLNADGSRLFETVLHFTRIEVATDVLYCTAVRLMLYKLTDESGLPEALITPTLDTQYQGRRVNPLLEPEQGGRLSSALEICRMVDYFTHSNQRSQGCLLLMFPLRVAYTHLSAKAASDHILDRKNSVGNVRLQGVSNFRVLIGHWSPSLM